MEQYDKKEKPTDVMCQSCFGTLIARTYLPSKNASEKYRVTEGYHCINCKAMYHDLPSSEIQKRTKQDKEFWEHARSILPEGKLLESTISKLRKRVKN